jgi:hypothetical protein
MADVTVSQQTVVYPTKTAGKRFAHSPGIDQSFDGHCRALLLKGLSRCQKPPL